MKKLIHAEILCGNAIPLNNVNVCMIEISKRKPINLRKSIAHKMETSTYAFC